MTAGKQLKWRNQVEFILTTMGYAIGFGNVWRFPYLVYFHGGAAFIIAYFILLAIIGVPIFLLEAIIGQYSGLNAINAMGKMVPLLKGVGYSSIVLVCGVGYFYVLLIAYSFYYFFVSIRAKLPWADCNGAPNCLKNANYTGPESCDSFRALLNASNITTQVSASRIYFFEEVLQLSPGIEDLGGMDWPLPLCLMLTYILVFFALFKGIRSLGILSYFTALFPYLVITILIVRGSFLVGSSKGVENYILNFDASKWAEARLWKDAAVQAFFSIGACCGGLIKMASHNNFKNNIVRDSFLVPFLDCFTGFYAGFAIFFVLGHMYTTQCFKTFTEVADQGPSLAFVAYPEGISLMGELAPLFSVCFFLMLLALGFGTMFSIVETAISTVLEIFENYIEKSSQVSLGCVQFDFNKGKKTILVRIGVVLAFFLPGLFLTTRGGFHLLELLDSSIDGIPYLIVGFFEVLVIVVYGPKRFLGDLEKISGKLSRPFFYGLYFIWLVVCPIGLIAIVTAMFFTMEPLHYPTYIEAIYWILSFHPFPVIIGFAVYEIYKSNFDWKKLLTCDPSFHDHYHNTLKEEEDQQLFENDKKETFELKSPAYSTRSIKGSIGSNKNNAVFPVLDQFDSSKL